MNNGVSNSREIETKHNVRGLKPIHVIRWVRVKLASQVNAPHNMSLRLGPTGWNLMVQSCLVNRHLRLTVWIEAWCMYATCSTVEWTVHTWEKMVEDSHQTGQKWEARKEANPDYWSRGPTMHRNFHKDRYDQTRPPSPSHGQWLFKIGRSQPSNFSILSLGTFFVGPT